MFREDLRVTMATSGLYEWLLKVVSVSGVLGGEEGDAVDGHGHEENKKEREREKDDKKQMLGQYHRLPNHVVAPLLAHCRPPSSH